MTKDEALKLALEALHGLCPMGYSWHRQGHGWRCAGGSHYVSDKSMMMMMPMGK
jgi:hypothetical protein